MGSPLLPSLGHSTELAKEDDPVIGVDYQRLIHPIRAVIDAIGLNGTI